MPPRRGTFKNVPQLVRAIESFIATHNTDGNAIAWTATADATLAKVERARDALKKRELIETPH